MTDSPPVPQVDYDRYVIAQLNCRSTAVAQSDRVAVLGREMMTQQDDVTDVVTWQDDVTDVVSQRVKLLTD